MKQIGRYEIDRELGRGAMGVVYAAEDPLIGRQVAIKTIRLGALDAAANHAELTQRLRREARAAGVLSHPGIITIYDVGEQGEDAYIVMEFIDGTTAEEMLDSGIQQRSGTLLSILKKAADALDYAHTKGIIHRDIKPSNIMLCRDGSVKIADFGVAKLTASSSMTQSGFVLGTPSYMSPEQAQGRAIDGRSDQFSLAVVAYRMLTGKLPFEGPTLTALLTKILWEEPEYEGAGLKPPIRPVFEKALAKDPLRRYASCIEFTGELEDAYASAKAEGLETAASMPRQAVASADSKAVLRGSGSEAMTTLALETAESPGKSAAQTASLITPVMNAETESFRSTPSVVPEIATRAPKRRSVLIACIAGLAAVALSIIGFFAMKAYQKPAPPFETETIPTALPLKQNTTEAVPPPPPLIQREVKEETVTPKPSTAKPVPDKTAAPVAPESKAKPIQSPAVKLPSDSGALTWSGSLEKNSILVIAEQKATVGSVIGQFPGKPIHIEVDPKDLLIRQMPSELNGWNQIILYSGTQKYTSITIRWRLLR